MIRLWLMRLEEGLIALLLAAMTLVTFMQVVARYIFNYSFSWAFELTTFIFAGLIFMGISYGIRVGAHIGVDAVIKLLPGKIARVINLISLLLCMAYSLVLFKGGWEYVDRMHMIGIYAQDVPIKAWIPRTILPIGFALMFLRFGQVFINLLRGTQTVILGDEAADALQFIDGDSNKQDKP